MKNGLPDRDSFGHGRIKWELFMDAQIALFLIAAPVI
jgi:hypothetical protein